MCQWKTLSCVKVGFFCAQYFAVARINRVKCLFRYSGVLTYPLHFGNIDTENRTFVATLQWQDHSGMKCS